MEAKKRFLTKNKKKHHLIPKKKVSTGRSLTPVAVSASDIPAGAGTWTTYRVPSWDGSAIPGLTNCNAATPCLPDYPSLGYNENSVIITTNQFALSGSSYFYRGAMIIAIPSSGLVSGSPFVYRASLPVPSMKVSLLATAGLVPTGNKLWLVRGVFLSVLSFFCFRFSLFVFGFSFLSFSSHLLLLFPTSLFLSLPLSLSLSPSPSIDSSPPTGARLST